MPRVTVRLDSIQCLKVNDGFLHGSTDEIGWLVVGGSPQGRIREELPIRSKYWRFKRRTSFSYSTFQRGLRQYESLPADLQRIHARTMRRIRRMAKSMILWEGDINRDCQVWLNVSFIEEDSDFVNTFEGIYQGMINGGLEKLISTIDNFQNVSNIPDAAKEADKAINDIGKSIDKAMRRTGDDLIGLWGIRLYCDKNGRLNVKWSTISRTSIAGTTQGNSTDKRIIMDMRGSDALYKIRVSAR